MNWGVGAFYAAVYSINNDDIVKALKKAIVFYNPDRIFILTEDKITR